MQNRSMGNARRGEKAMAEQVPNMDVPPPPVQPRRGGWRRWLLIGGIGCFGLLVLLIIGFAGCAALIGGTGGGGDSAEETPEQIRQRAVPVGETVEVGDVAWTVSNVQESNELRALGERKQGRFITVDVTFINNGTEPVTLDSASLAILDDQNRTFETDPDASFYVPTNLDLFLNQVNPGVTKQGRAIFTVAPDAQGLVLRAGDTNPFGGEDAYVNLGV